MLEGTRPSRGTGCRWLPVFFVSVLSLTTGCGALGLGSSDDDSSTTSQPGDGDATGYLIDGETGGEESVDGDSPTAASTSTVVAVPAIELIPTLDQRMTELSAVTGRPYAASLIFDVFSMPADVPIFGGNTTGTFVSATMSPEGIIRESRTVGTDDVINFETLSAFNDTVDADPATSWESAFVSDEGDALSSTLVPKDGSDSQFIVRAIAAPGPANTSLHYESVFTVAEMTLPQWISALPLPPGGVMINYREGVGQVVVGGTPAQNGYVELQVHYPQESREAIEQLYGGDALAAAGFGRSADGFALETRLDVSNGPWTGAVYVYPREHLGVVGFAVQMFLAQPAG